MNAMYGSPVGLLLDVWLALPSGDAIGVIVMMILAVCLGLVLRRARRQTRWPRGKP